MPRVSSLLNRLIRRRRRPPAALFDADRYLRLYRDVALAGVDPAEHYVVHGWREGRSPHLLFDARWYGRQCGEAPPGDPLADYASRGWRAAASPHPLFDVAHYRRQLGAAPGVADLIHYLTVGWRRSIDPHPYFSVRHYLLHSPEIGDAGIEPLTHYLGAGAAEDRPVHPEFDSAFYRAAYLLDVRDDCVPLVDFAIGGWVLGRRPRADAGPAWREAAFRRLGPQAALTACAIG